MHMSQMVYRCEQMCGERIATEFQGRSFTWAQTAERVRKMAGMLQQLGIQANRQVAVLSLNSDLYFTSLFGVPHMGARIVPLNIRWALPEFVYALNDSETCALMFDEAFLPVAEQLRSESTQIKHYLFMGSPQACPEWAVHVDTALEEAAPLLDFQLGDQELAGIFYTGGTTGFPKGVMLTHTALFTSALSLVAASDATQDDSMLHAAPMFHMADLAACFMFTLLGGRNVIVPAFEPKLVLNTIAESGVTDALLVPAMIQMVFDHPEFAAEKLVALKRILYGASPMPEGLMRRVMQAAPGARLFQAYGQTELAPIATILKGEDHVLEGERSRLLRSAGRSSCSTLIKVINDQGQPVPVGEVGEICCTGPNVMLGYWNKPEQTESTLIDGWVHTGDAGYLDEEGYLFLVDRVKDMIVTGGENVYSAEVESVVSQHPGVAQVAVIGVPDENWGELVHAIVVPRAGQTPEGEDIIAHCRTLIAGYKCPKSVELRYEPLPLSGAGKILKRELRAPYWEGRDRQVN